MGIKTWAVAAASALAIGVATSAGAASVLVQSTGYLLSFSDPDNVFGLKDTPFKRGIAFTETFTLSDLVARPLNYAPPISAFLYSGGDGQVTLTLNGVEKTFDLTSASGELSWNFYNFYGHDASGDDFSIWYGGGGGSAGAFIGAGGFDAYVYPTLTVDPDPRPLAVPEPSTWALAIIGLGLLGAALRQRPAPSREEKRLEWTF